MSTRTIFTGIFLWLFLMGVVDIAGAVPIVSYTNTYDSGTTTWTYESTITNDTADLLYDFVISPTVEPLSGADLTLEGWGAAEVGNVSPYFVHWMADFGSEILLGDTMGGFWFTYSGSADADIGPLAYTVTLWDQVNDTPYTVDGQTAPVPEPGTIWLIMTGLGGLGILYRVRNQKTVVIDIIRRLG